MTMVGQEDRERLYKFGFKRIDEDCRARCKMVDGKAVILKTLSKEWLESKLEIEIYERTVHGKVEYVCAIRPMDKIVTANCNE